MSAVTLELQCGQCRQWWMRWTVDTAENFDEQLPYAVEHVRHGVVNMESPGGYRPATDGRWYRWTPGPAAALPEGEVWTRYVFVCPNGCHTSPQPRGDKLHAAAETVLRHLHKQRMSFCTTVDKLLEYSA